MYILRIHSLHIMLEIEDSVNTVCCCFILHVSIEWLSVGWSIAVEE